MLTKDEEILLGTLFTEFYFSILMRNLNINTLKSNHLQEVFDIMDMII